MPSSSNPFNLLTAWIVIMTGLPCVPVGVAGFFAESGGMRWLFGILALAGIAMMWGGIQMIVAWRRATRQEAAHQDALWAAVREEESAAAAPEAEDARVLAHWRYEPGEWSAYTGREYRFRRREAFWLGLGIAGGGTLFLMLTRSAPLPWALGVSVVIGAAIGVGRVLAARSARAGNAATPEGGEVVISPRAILLNGRYHALQDERFWFGGVKYLEGETPPVLEFTVKWKTRSGVTNEQTRVPVPRGREEEARALAASFPAPSTRRDGTIAAADEARSPT